MHWPPSLLHGLMHACRDKLWGILGGTSLSLSSLKPPPLRSWRTFMAQRQLPKEQTSQSWKEPLLMTPQSPPQIMCPLVQMESSASQIPQRLRQMAKMWLRERSELRQILLPIGKILWILWILGVYQPRAFISNKAASRPPGEPAARQP